MIGWQGNQSFILDLRNIKKNNSARWALSLPQDRDTPNCGRYRRLMGNDVWGTCTMLDPSFQYKDHLAYQLRDNAVPIHHFIYSPKNGTRHITL